MCPGSEDEPRVVEARAGLFWSKKVYSVDDEKVDGEYALIINGHSLVRLLPILTSLSSCRSIEKNN